MKRKPLLAAFFFVLYSSNLTPLARADDANNTAPAVSLKKHKAHRRKSRRRKSASAKADSGHDRLLSSRLQKESRQDWAAGLQERFDQTASEQHRLASAALVHGTELPDLPPLYWTGRAPSGRFSAEELLAFNAGLSKAISGDNAGAKHLFDAFLTQYPKSRFCPEAQAALTHLVPAPK
jgi:TolA-binding protein